LQGKISAFRGVQCHMVAREGCIFPPPAAPQFDSQTAAVRTLAGGRERAWLEVGTAGFVKIFTKFWGSHKRGYRTKLTTTWDVLAIRGDLAMRAVCDML